ncbi:hypothetical protein KAI65_00390 [Candidatus Parcubacteria bacterium]|nr:hypothetical protein [Candidatus Parcubacteria bacterium]
MKEYKIKKAIIVLLIFLISFSTLFNAINVWAAEVMTTDAKGTAATEEGIIQNMKDWAVSFWNWTSTKEGDAAAAIAFKSALGTFLDRLAYDAATYLATGDKGQAPMFQTDNFGDFLTNAADVAAGDFMEEFGKEYNFDLCELNPAIKLKVGLGLYRSRRPGEPDCTFTEMKDNWEETLNDPNFLNRFQAMYDPRQNDLGTALSLQSKIVDKVADEKKEKTNVWMKNTFKPVTEKISGYITTPSELVHDYAEETLDTATDGENVYTGNVIADSIDMFINTLIGKLAKKWFKDGLVLKFPENSYQGDWGGFTGFSDYESSPYSEGAKGAEARFAVLNEPVFDVRGDYEILAELTACPDPQKAGPTNCVITDKFREAIAEKNSVSDAIEKGYLNPDWTFGFDSDGLEPEHNGGFPYRSMLILRKFRIIPVGWELAAEYIKDNLGNIEGTKDLGDMVACFSAGDEHDGYFANWCKGLVDPTWVLKAPLNYCKKEGPGPEIITEKIMGEDSDSVLAIVRNDNYCADEQSCIKENDDGSCELYGYCSKERRKWDFNGESCDSEFNTCQTFKKQDGQSASYLENTLNYEGCNADNAGCKAYCQDYDFLNNEYDCNMFNGNKMYLDGDVEECDEDAEGCHEFIRVKQGLGTNLINNSSFESDDGAWVRVEDGYDGRWSAALGAVDLTNTQFPIPNDVNGLDFSEMPITFSLYMKNCGTDVKIEAGIGMEDGVLEMSEKIINTSNNWQRFEVAHKPLINVPCDQIFVSIENQEAGCLIDAVQLEFNERATRYKDYQESNVVYQKLAPDYLNCSESESVTSFMQIANWIFQESIDPVLGHCGSPPGSGPEGTRVDNPSGAYLVANGGDWELGLGPNTWGFGEDAPNLDGLSNNDYDGMLISDPINVPNSATALHLWRNVKMRSFDLHPGLPDIPDAYYLEIRDATGNSVLATIESWEPSVWSVNNLTDYDAGAINYDISAFAGQTITISMQLVGHQSVNDCLDGSGDDALAQISDVYIVYESVAGIDSPKCDNFSRWCNADEVGCDMYTAVKDKMSIAGKATADDYCPDECVGYNEYFQTQTAFDSLQPQYFVPASAEKCGASSVGCDEFTNLDELGLGAEAREYYSELRQCRKPDESCAEFYTWEGSSETGYQLRVYNLEKDGIASDYGPQTTRNDASECSKEIYNKPATDPDYNSDCREFYNKNGEITYHLYTRTISCSDNCHPYRRTENNIIENEATAVFWCNEECNGDFDCESKCVAADCENQSNTKVCVFDSGEAVFCKNGGLWNSQHERCLYDAVPGEGKKCSAKQAGCREYSGSSGNNMRFILNDDIESGTNENWQGDLPVALNPSSEALMVGGHSLYVSGADNEIFKILGSILELDKSYYISFIAKSADAGAFTGIGFGVDNVDIEFELGEANNYELDSEWKFYNFNLTSLNNDTLDYIISNEEKIIIQADSKFYIDNIRLVEIIDRYYLIKNSWDIDACMYDVSDIIQDRYYNLGCESYLNTQSEIHNLRQFSKLCHESAVGCELMIDTYNYSEFGSADLPLAPTDVSPTINIPKDKFIFAVYDKDKQCYSADKGCERLGEPYTYENQVKYSDIFLKNNPDKYETILCGSDAVQCEIWLAGDGTEYFKDPGDQVCEYIQPYGDVNSIGWYKKQIKKCDIDNSGEINDPDIGPIENEICHESSDCASDGNVCDSNDDCAENMECEDNKCYNSCVLDKFNYKCLTEFKTIGYGGQEIQVYQPSAGWTGVCPASESGCSELIDPVSKFSTNLIFNNDFLQDDDSNGVPDGWVANVQDINMGSYTLYRLAGSNNAGNITIDCPNDIYRLDENNNLLNIGNSFALQLSLTEVKSALIYSDSNTDCAIEVDAASGDVELKKAIIDYQINYDLDMSSCNGVVDFEKGCVLLNERAITGTGFVGLKFDANLTINDGNGTSPAVGAATNRNANQLIKVQPDRVCAEWLACRSSMEDLMTGEHKCYNVGNCVKMNSSGQCQSFVNYSGIHSFNINNDQDTSGYVIMDQYHLGNMQEVGAEANVGNGSFEMYDSDNYPLDWYLDGTIWDPDYAYVINNPYEAEISGIVYPMEGRSLLKLGAGQRLVSNSTQVEVGQDYYISYMVNTYHLSSTNNDAKAQVVLTGGANEIFESDESVYGWTAMTKSFKPTSGFMEISLQAESVSGADLKGSIYFDNIRITPVIETPDFIPKTCRLYPTQESFTCNSYDMIKGIDKGMEGYCMEYDRYPGNRDACLMWYPVDRIKSSSIIERGVGYEGKFPVYYCADMDANFDFVEKRTSKIIFDKDDYCCDLDFWAGIVDWTGIGSLVTEGEWRSGLDIALSGAGCGSHYSEYYDGCLDADYKLAVMVYEDGECGGGWDLGTEYNIRYTCVPKNDVAYPAIFGSWYVYDGDLVHNEPDSDPPVMIYNYTTSELMYPENYRLQCDKFYQVVSDTADDKAWTGRVRTGSDYALSGLGGYVYGDEDPPFGSAIIPAEVKSPEDWDGIVSTDEYDRLFFRENLSESVISGLPYGCHGPSCKDIGRCSNHEEIVCAHPYPGGAWDYGDENSDEHYLDLQCPAGETCDLINNLDNVDSNDTKDIISSLFVESYRTVIWDWGANRYDIDNIIDNILPPADCLPADIIDRYAAVNGPTCKILPIIDNVTLEDGSDNVVWGGVAPTFTIINSGYYTLKFTSVIDEEQLPLSRIDIDWADGVVDSPAAYGELNDRPNIEEPHEFIHYYTIGTYDKIGVALTDNWGASASN